MKSGLSILLLSVYASACDLSRFPKADGKPIFSGGIVDITKKDANTVRSDNDHTMVHTQYTIGGGKVKEIIGMDSRNFGSDKDGTKPRSTGKDGTQANVMLVNIEQGSPFCGKFVKAKLDDRIWQNDGVGGKRWDFPKGKSPEDKNKFAIKDPGYDQLDITSHQAKLLGWEGHGKANLKGIRIINLDIHPESSFGNKNYGSSSPSNTTQKSNQTSKGPFYNVENGNTVTQDSTTGVWTDCHGSKVSDPKQHVKSGNGKDTCNNGSKKYSKKGSLRLLL